MGGRWTATPRDPSGSARNTSSGTGLPFEASVATSKQNDLRRMSNEWAVELSLIRDSSIRTVTSGSLTQSELTRSKMSFGISTVGLSRESDFRCAAHEPPSFLCPMTTYRRNAARTAAVAAVEL